MIIGYCKAEITIKVSFYYKLTKVQRGSKKGCKKSSLGFTITWRAGGEI
jgi:hypothetical protein